MEKQQNLTRRNSAMTVQTYTRTAGALMLLSFVAGGFGEAYVPSRLIVSGDATATAENFKALDSLFRIGFAGYLVEASCDIALTLILYALLRPVRKDIALLEYAPGSLLLLIAPGGLALAVWFLVRGVDVPKWEEKVSAGRVTGA
jgi:hypothetical protein